MTGQHTGRSVQDKFVADDPETTKEIWWGKVNQKLDPAKFDAQLKDCEADYAAQREKAKQTSADADKVRAEWDASRAALAKKTFDARASPYVE